MIGEYSCPYLSNSGKACVRACIIPKGCQFHWKAKKQVSCSDCRKPTVSACDQCSSHIKGYYVVQYYNRLRAKALNQDRGYNIEIN